MKAIIEHEIRGRIRFRFVQKQMSLEQADLLEAWFRKVSGVTQVTVHERTRCLVVQFRGDRKTILAAVSSFSWEQAEKTVTPPAHSSRELNREFQEKLVAKIVMKTASTLFFPMSWQIVRTCWHAIPFVKRGLHCIFRRKMQVELLDAISVGISLARRDFPTAGSVMFLLELGELLEEWTRKKSIQDLAQCMSLNVDRVWLRTPEGEVLVPISQVQPGDRLVVRAGGVIPVDGVVVEGEAMVNQASLTGESVPIEKRLDSPVYAGTVVEEGECILEVRQASGQSRYDQIITLIEQSEQMKSATESKAANLADKLVPYTFAGSVLAFLLTRNPTRALSVLMVDFSCALKLAMPLTVISAMREAGKEHMTVKGGKFMEAMAQADTIVFDKTGTLTNACPRVAQVVPFCGYEEQEMLRLAACLEEHFPHSVANAVVEEARQRELKHEEYHSKVQYIVAHGIASKVGDQKVVIGSAHFVFEDEKCVIPEEEREKFDALPPEYSHLYLAIDNKLAAVICIVDPLREEASAVLAALKDIGIHKTVMLTGDSERTAAAIAAQVGVDHFDAEVLPEDKANFVAELRRRGHTVVMVGDGINDSPALSEADVGIAISDGAAIAQEISDITISGESLWELVRLRQISVEMMKRIHANYRFVLGFNSMLIVLGVFGILAPAASATLHNLSTLGISLHSMTALPDPDKKKKQ